MPDKRLLVHTEPPEICVAEIHDGTLFDFDIERAGRVLGDIYQGRVENVLPGMDGAFVDVGLRRNALLYVGDVYNAKTAQTSKHASISQLVRPNDEITVQVARPPVGGKGARVTMKLSLPGRYLVLLAYTDSVGVSKKIESANERNRLRRIAEKYRPLDHGIILRTEAENATEQELQHDIDFLWQRLQSLRERAAKVKPPALLHRESGLLERIIRDRFTDDISAVYVDSEETFHYSQNLASSVRPKLVDRVQIYQDEVPLFKKFSVSDDLEAASGRVVNLKRGGSISIDETEAVVAIDVNTGGFTGKKQLADTVLETNLQAVQEIARQLRVRNLGGVIVIDFIDMPRTRDRAKVLNRLEAELKNDRTKTRIVDISPSGLVEMTRQREGFSLRQMLHENCPRCDGNGVIPRATTTAIQIRRRIRELSQRIEAKPVAVIATIHPEVSSALLGSNESLIEALEDTTEAKVFIQADESIHSDDSMVVASSGHEPPDKFSIGQKIYLQEKLPLYPHLQPQFLALQERLVKIELTEELESKTQHEEHELPPCILEITQVHRWFATAKIVAYGTPERVD